MPEKCPIKAKAKAEGKLFYFTGIPCIRGHICQRRVHRSVCILCEKARSDKRWAKNGDSKEARKKWKQEYYSKYPERYEQLIENQRKKYYLDEEFRNKQNLQKKKTYYKNRKNENFVKKERERLSIWSKNNLAKKRISGNKRRATELNATPSWLTAIHKAQISEFYEIAIALEMQTGIKHHVDHIIPLKNKAVSGLHVPWNLQVLTATQNYSKGNRYEI